MFTGIGFILAASALLILILTMLMRKKRNGDDAQFAMAVMAVFMCIFFIAGGAALDENTPEINNPVSLQKGQEGHNR